MTTTTSGGPWLLLQLSDGGFPSGGFAHSQGLEAAWVLGGLEAFGGAVEGVRGFVETSLRQSGRFALPFVRAAAREPQRLAPIDDALDARLVLMAPNHASRAQGRALARAAAGIWDRLAFLVEHAKNQGPSHHPCVFGAMYGALGVDPEDAATSYLHGSARAILSAAIRLGLTGPIEAQRIHASLAPLFDDVLVRSRSWDALEDAAPTTPLLEIFAALHDRLDGRMFQS
jgi:urease accessory protein